MEFNATFIISAISFIIFTMIMNAIFYKPLQNVVDERTKFIDETYEEAKHNKQKADSILRDKHKKVEKTKFDAKKIILDKANESKEQKDLMAKEAQQKAFSEIDSAKGELNKSKSEAQDVLSGNVIDLAQNISSKILGEEFSIKNVDKNLINETMGEGSLWV